MRIVSLLPCLRARTTVGMVACCCVSFHARDEDDAVAGFACLRRCFDGLFLSIVLLF